MCKKLVNIPWMYSRFLLLILLTFAASLHLSKVQKISKCSRGEEITNTTEALRKGLIYIKKHDESKTLDVALGIALIKGNLQWIVNTLEETFRTGNTFHGETVELIRMCDDLFHDISTRLRNSASGRDRKFSTLLTYYFRHILAGDLKYGSLNQYGFQLPNFTNCSSISAYFFEGTENSDFCILELLDSNCDVSSACLWQEASYIQTSGYKTSHRLLYLQVASKCGKRQPWIFGKSEYARRNLCERMLAEVNALNGQNIFPARDLLLENIALCGFEGYVEFWKKQWMETILKWQRRNGCFGFTYPEQLLQKSCNGFPDFNVRTKRDDVVVQGVCHTHITAVAMSALAFLLRVHFYESVIHCYD